MLLDFFAGGASVFFVRLDIIISDRIRVIKGVTSESVSPPGMVRSSVIMSSPVMVGVVTASERTLNLLAPLRVLGVNESRTVGLVVVITATRGEGISTMLLSSSVLLVHRVIIRLSAAPEVGIGISLVAVGLESNATTLVVLLLIGRLDNLIVNPSWAVTT